MDYFLSTLGPEHTRYQVVTGAMDCMLRYNWPGNVRELRNAIERAMILAENGIITERCLPRDLQEAADGGGQALTLGSVERQHILKLLEAYGGNRQQAAEALGISRKTLYRRLRQYNIE